MTKLMVWPYFRRGPYPYVELDYNQRSYGPRREIRGDWLEFSFAAFRLIRETGRCPVNAFVTVGTGVGLDAIGAAHILRPQHIVALDIHEQVAELAHRNIEHNVRIPEPHPVVDVLQSDMLTALSPGFKADLIYENLPNIPAYKPLDYRQDILSATYFARDVETVVDAPIAQYLLSSHHDILRQSLNFLSPTGHVLCSIGGRVPVSVLDHLFESAGYRHQVLVVGLKEQTEAEEVLSGYRWAEAEHGVVFRFVDLDGADIDPGVQLLGPVSWLQVEELTAVWPWISAHEAWSRWRQGHRVGHLVFAIFAHPQAPVC